jgi:hypothetical protein
VFEYESIYRVKVDEDTRSDAVHIGLVEERRDKLRERSKASSRLPAFDCLPSCQRHTGSVDLRPCWEL